MTPKRRTWVGRWVRDENWWRDVASQTAAGLIVAVVVALVGVGIAAGFKVIDWPAVLRWVLAIVVVLVALGIGLAAAIGLNLLLRPINAAARKAPYVLRLLWEGIALPVLAGAIVLVLYVGAVQLIRVIFGS